MEMCHKHEVTIKFCFQFYRPTSRRYIHIYAESGTRVISIDVSLSSSPVVYPSNTLGREFTFTTDYRFVEKQSYYVLLDSGLLMIIIVLCVYENLHAISCRSGCWS